MQPEILFQMDHCPAMFDNCHRYQYDGPSKNGKTKLNQIQRAMWQNQKSNVLKSSYVISFTMWPKLATLVEPIKHRSTFMSPTGPQPDLGIAGGEFMQHFLPPPPVIRANVFMPTGLSSAKCIAAPSQMYCVYKCITTLSQMYCIIQMYCCARLAQNESLAEAPC